MENAGESLRSFSFKMKAGNAGIQNSPFSILHSPFPPKEAMIGAKRQATPVWRARCRSGLSVSVGRRALPTVRICRRQNKVEAQFVALGVETLKLALILSLPMLMAGLIAGLAISIFQATTQINEMTLSFIPKILVVAVVMIITMPWMMNQMIDFTTHMFNMIKTYAF